METLASPLEQMRDSLRTSLRYLYLTEEDPRTRTELESYLLRYALEKGITVAEMNDIYREAMDPRSEIQPHYEITEVYS